MNKIYANFFSKYRVRPKNKITSRLRESHVHNNISRDFMYPDFELITTHKAREFNSLLNRHDLCSSGG